MSFDVFSEWMFKLARAWVPGEDAGAYASLLGALYDAITLPRAMPTTGFETEAVIPVRYRPVEEVPSLRQPQQDRRFRIFEQVIRV